MMCRLRFFLCSVLVFLFSLPRTSADGAADGVAIFRCYDILTFIPLVLAGVNLTDKLMMTIMM